MPAAAPGTTRASPLNPMQSELCDFHMNTTFARAMACMQAADSRLLKVSYQVVLAREGRKSIVVVTSATKMPHLW